MFRLCQGLTWRSILRNPSSRLRSMTSWRASALLAAGRRDAAIVLWESVVEILHHPARGGQQLLGSRLPPLYRPGPWLWWSQACARYPVSPSASCSSTGVSCCRGARSGTSPGWCARGIWSGWPLSTVHRVSAPAKATNRPCIGCGYELRWCLRAGGLSGPCSSAGRGAADARGTHPATEGGHPRRCRGYGNGSLRVLLQPLASPASWGSARAKVHCAADVGHPEHSLERGHFASHLDAFLRLVGATKSVVTGVWPSTATYLCGEPAKQGQGWGLGAGRLVGSAVLQAAPLVWALDAA